MRRWQVRLRACALLPARTPAVAAVALELFLTRVAGALMRP